MDYIASRLREVLSFLGRAKVKQKRHNNDIIFRVQSEDDPEQTLRLKVEINCMEHFHVLPLQEMDFCVENQWFSGACRLTAYQLSELIGTKLRALFQRRKGRDLFDLYVALTRAGDEINVDDVLNCYQRYMDFTTDHLPTYKEYVLNIEEKLQDSEFAGDTAQLIDTSMVFNPEEAYRLVKEMLIDKLPGDRWEV